MATLKPFRSVQRPALTEMILHDVPFELVPRTVPFFLCNTPTGFPSPAQDDMH
jgi:DNA polymerase V